MAETIRFIFSSVFIFWLSALTPVGAFSEAAAQPSENRANSIESQAAKAAETVVVVIGDSLAAGYGVKKEESFPEKAAEILRARGKAVRVINGSIAGSVTADADRRLKFYLRAKPKILLLELGGNDGLKGTPPEVIKNNLAKAIDLAKENGITVLLAGIRVYSNIGAEYSKNFEKVFSDLAREKKVAFMPFILEGVALDRALNQSDMKHPNAKGHEIIAQKLARELERLMTQEKSS